MIIKISAKCSDLFSAFIETGSGEQVKYTGYVPSFFPGKHWGDYVMLDIDLETGQILNWEKPMDEQLAEFLDECVPCW